METTIKFIDKLTEHFIHTESYVAAARVKLQALKQKMQEDSTAEQQAVATDYTKELRELVAMFNFAGESLAHVAILREAGVNLGVDLTSEFKKQLLDIAAGPKPQELMEVMLATADADEDGEDSRAVRLEHFAARTQAARSLVVFYDIPKDEIIQSHHGAFNGPGMMGFTIPIEQLPAELVERIKSRMGDEEAIVEEIPTARGAAVGGILGRILQGLRPPEDDKPEDDKETK